MLFPKNKNMKKVEALIRPGELNAVQEGLLESGLAGATVMEAGVFVESEGEFRLEPRVKLEMYLEDMVAPRAADIIAKVVASEARDRSRVFVTPAEESIRFRPEV